MSRLATLLLMAGTLFAQQPKTFLVKLGTPVNSRTSKAGAPIRAAIISPESLHGGYLEGSVEKSETKPGGRLVLRFDKLLYQGKTTPLQTEVTSWVNSKGHQSVDDAERATTLEKGALRTAGPELWLDEGSEIRLRNDTQ